MTALVHGTAGERREHGARAYSGILRWITTTNHKDIGTMYHSFEVQPVLKP